MPLREKGKGKGQKQNNQWDNHVRILFLKDTPVIDTHIGLKYSPKKQNIVLVRDTTRRKQTISIKHTKTSPVLTDVITLKYVPSQIQKQIISFLSFIHPSIEFPLFKMLALLHLLIKATRKHQPDIFRM